MHILYGDGNWPDCWVKHWTDLELFPVISPTLLNNLPLRTVRDLRNHVILHADDGREWHAWLAAVDALDLLRARHHFMTDARIAIEAATYGHGVALGDSMTVRRHAGERQSDRAVRPVGAGGRTASTSSAATRCGRRRSSRSSSTGLMQRLPRTTPGPSRRSRAAPACAVAPKGRSRGRLKSLPASSARIQPAGNRLSTRAPRTLQKRKPVR